MSALKQHSNITIREHLQSAWDVVAKGALPKASGAFVRFALFLRDKFVAFGRFCKNKFLAMPSETRKVITLVLFLSVFFLWQLLAYSVQQTTFVTVNLLMVSLVAFATCRILMSNQKKVALKEHDNEELRAQIDAKDKEVLAVRKELAVMKSKKSKADLINESNELFRTLQKQAAKDDENVLAPYQFVFNALNKFYGDTGKGILCGVAYSRVDNSDQFSLAGQYALAKEPAPVIDSLSCGITSQVIYSGKAIKELGVPAEYLQALSGLGSSDKVNIYHLPFLKNGVVSAVVEFCSFNDLYVFDNWDVIAHKLDNA